MSTSGLGPAPGARTRPDGDAPPATSFIPAITVERLIPDASVTRACPPRPNMLRRRARHQPPLPLIQQRRHHLEESRERLRRDLHTATLLRANNNAGNP